jgi:hypothetical protein
VKALRLNAKGPRSVRRQRVCSGRCAWDRGGQGNLGSIEGRSRGWPARIHKSGAAALQHRHLCSGKLLHIRVMATGDVAQLCLRRRQCHPLRDGNQSTGDGKESHYRRVRSQSATRVQVNRKYRRCLPIWLAQNAWLLAASVLKHKLAGTVAQSRSQPSRC